MTISAASGLRARPGELTNEELRNYVASPLAACSTASLDPDEWFPIAAGTARARAEASHALAVCAICPIQAECLEMSLRQWSSVGQHGIWGGLVAAERQVLRREWRSGIPVAKLLSRQTSARLSRKAAVLPRRSRILSLARNMNGVANNPGIALHCLHFTR